MSPTVHEFVSIDLLPLLAGVLASVSCGLLGNYLVLRRVSLMGDAISHAVLPGIVVAFLVAGTRQAWPIFVGAGIAGLVTVLLVEAVRSLGRVERGAAMGVVFSVLFALGVVLIEQAAARNVDLDADCVLHGQLETLFWFPPETWGAFFSLETLAALPRQVPTLGVTLLVVSVVVALFFKELRIATFDPALATALGFPAGAINTGLLVLVAMATVASFEAVGSILVIAMLICPAATARLLTDRLGVQVWLSVGIAGASAVAGYLLAAFGPGWFGWGGSVNAAGMMATVSGVFFAAALVLSPSHGLIGKAVDRWVLAWRVSCEDILAAAYRESERETVGVLSPRAAQCAGGALGRLALVALRARGELRRVDEGYKLTPTGLERSAAIVRSHRLWEAYLVDRVGLRPDHVHDTAMRLEHLRRGRARLEPLGPSPAEDPHRRPIPGAGDGSPRSGS